MCCTECVPRGRSVACLAYLDHSRGERPQANVGKLWSALRVRPHYPLSVLLSEFRRKLNAAQFISFVVNC
jgi:hypothetical protein